ESESQCLDTSVQTRSSRSGPRYIASQGRAATPSSPEGERPEQKRPWSEPGARRRAGERRAPEPRGIARREHARGPRGLESQEAFSSRQLLSPTSCGGALPFPGEDARSQI